jgi:hypothetical protein
MDGSVNKVKEANMPKNQSIPWLAVTASAWFFLLPGASHAEGKPMPNRELTEATAKVRKGATLAVRTEAAQHLAELTRGIDPQKVDDTALAELVSLLDTSEDPVRFWVAASLGNLGPRAKEAAPKLLKLLPQVDCLRGSLTSAPAIRKALERIGVKPPPPKCDNTPTE